MAPLGATRTAAPAAAPQVAAAVGRLHRALRRRVRESLAGPALPQAQVEVMRLLAARPGLRAHEVAEDLGLAPNTVSTLIQSLARRGYVAREVDSRDRRAARLSLTTAAVERMHTWHDTRAAVLARALAALEVADAASIAATLPALERLADLLEDSLP